MRILVATAEEWELGRLLADWEMDYTGRNARVFETTSEGTTLYTFKHPPQHLMNTLERLVDTLNGQHLVVETYNAAREQLLELHKQS